MRFACSSGPNEIEEDQSSSDAIPPGCEAIASPMTASVFQIAVEKGQSLHAGEKVIVLDAMKTEIAICTPRPGIVEEIRCVQGSLVHAGQAMIVLRTT
jgi:urea carboxylase